MRAGVATSVTTGAGACTITVADVGVLPPEPVQLRLYVVLPVGDTLKVPLAGSVPAQPPDASHEVELVDDHCKVAAPPAVITAGTAVKSTTGADDPATVTTADANEFPPDPLQSRE
jgi:hypothetical protein